MNKIVLGLVGVAMASYIGYSEYSKSQIRKQVELEASIKMKSLQDKISEMKEKEEADNRLGQYAINMMYNTSAGRELSDGKKLILAQAIVRVASDIFTSIIDQHAFIQALAIESSFKRFAQSPTGPKGYTQVARGTFHESMKDCGINNLHDEDVWETDINLYAGACYFRKMLEKANGDQFIAAVAYNQGSASESFKSYSKSGTMHEIEPLKYVAKMLFLKNNTTDQKTANVPSIKELEKAAGPTKKAMK